MVRARLKEVCLGGVEALSRPLEPLGEYAFITPMDPSEAKKYKFEGACMMRRGGGVGC